LDGTTTPSNGTTQLDGTTRSSPSAASPSDAPSPPTNAASGRPLNLDLHPHGPTAGRGSIGLMPLMPAPPERKSKLADGIDKSGKPDCRSAFADKGLLAVAPLAAAAVTDKGCRW
jgi:hypothetical protein